MKSITLFGPTIVAGAVRHPHENPVVVSNREAARLEVAGVLSGAPEDVDGDHDDDADPEADDLDDKTIAQLTTIAEAESIDLTGLTIKADIIAAIRAHRKASVA